MHKIEELWFIESNWILNKRINHKLRQEIFIVFNQPISDFLHKELLSNRKTEQRLWDISPKKSPNLINMKMCWIWLEIRKKQIKISVRCHCTSSILAKIKSQTASDDGRNEEAPKFPTVLKSNQFTKQWKSWLKTQHSKN